MVTDTGGAVLVQVSIEVKNLDTGFEIVANTNDLGLYAVKELTVGRYRVQVEVPASR